MVIQRMYHISKEINCCTLHYLFCHTGLSNNSSYLETNLKYNFVRVPFIIINIIIYMKFSSRQNLYKMSVEKTTSCFLSVRFHVLHSTKNNVTLVSSPVFWGRSFCVDCVSSAAMTPSMNSQVVQQLEKRRHVPRFRKESIAVLYSYIY